MGGKTSTNVLLCIECVKNTLTKSTAKANIGKILKVRIKIREET